MAKAEKKKIKYPTVIVMLLAVSFVFGGASAIIAYATGNEIVGTGKLYMVSHTEYRFSEPGQIIARLVDFQGNPVVVNNCTATILYPDKTFFVNEQLMTESGNISGDHYYAFTTPNGPEGVYEYQATCTYAAGSKTASVTNSFHLSSAFNQVLGNLTSIQSDLQSINNTLVTEISNLNNSLQTTETNILNELGSVNSSLYTQMSNVNSSLTSYINQTFSDLNGSFSGDIQNVLNDIDNLQTNINNQLACGGADATISLDEGPTSTWQQESVADAVNHGIAFTTNYPNTTFFDAHLKWAEAAQVSDAALFDENLTLLYSSSGTGFQTIEFGGGSGVNLPYAGTYYLLGTRGLPATTTFQEANTTVAASFSNALYTLGNGFACGLNEITSCSGYASTGTIIWNFDRLDLSVDTTTGEADMCQLIRDVNTSIQTALAAEFSDLYLALDGNFSVITSNQAAMNVTLENVNTFVQEINVTTTNTYDYVTGTLANNVNSVLSQLGVINETVNRIETVSNQINDTTTSILQNQEDQVYMTTFSG